MTVKQIKEHVIEKGISQKYLADQLGVSQVTVTNWFKGYNKPTARTINKIKELFNLNQNPSHYEWDDNRR